MTVTLRQVQAFLAVAECGTFTRAAERLHATQPALSRLVRELESGLGIYLFDRTTRRVELTEAGREFRGAAAKLVADLDMAVRNASDLGERRRGRIAIGAPPLLAAVIMPQVVAEMRRRHPGIRATLIDTRTDAILEAVRLGHADCAIGTFASAENGIARLTLARDRLMLFCRAAHPLARRRSVDWAHLADEPIVALTRDSGIRILADIGFETAKIVARPAYEVSQITTALALVGAGLGVTVLPAFARLAASRHRLVARPLTHPDLARDVSLIRADSRIPTPAFAAFEPIVRRVVRQLVR